MRVLRYLSPLSVPSFGARHSVLFRGRRDTDAPRRLRAVPGV
jgi:hypothetical protein